MRRLRRAIGAWPITFKVPLMVVALMVAVSLVLSDQVLGRLSETQQRHLEALAETYLDGLSAAIQPHVLRDDVWEIYDQLDRARRGYLGVKAANAIVTTPDGTVLAASDPRLFPTQETVPDWLRNRFRSGSDLVLDEGEGRAYARRALSYQGRALGWIYAEIDIRDLLAERREVLLALIVTNAVLTLLFAGIGYLAVRRMIRPIGILADHLERGRGGRVEAIPPGQVGARHSEFGRLFRRYNAMVRALSQREILAARLAEEEKMASLGRLASGMAHEINNPLGGMFNAIDTIERHEDDPAVRRASLAIVKRGLAGIRDVVRATLVTYKGTPVERGLRPSDLDDLRFLVRHEILRRRLTLLWENRLARPLELPVGPLRQAVLNLLLNACAASPVEGRVTFEAREDGDDLRISVGDQGPGMPPEIAAVLEGEAAAATPGPEGRGLGAWMVGRLMTELSGRVCVGAGEGGGTWIEIAIPLSREGGLRKVA